jgi:ABC-type polar amino acid transport system ATPase subunit
MLSLRVSNLNKAYGTSSVLRDVSVSFPAGKLSAIIGRSGCGKSTLLRCIQGLEPFQSGEIQFGEQTLSAAQSVQGATALRQWRSQFGMVFQSFHLFPHLTLEANLTKAPEVVLGWKPSQAREFAHELLRKVGLEPLAKRYPSQLSGGQQQRAAIARALAMQPKVMLYDEPTSALDPWLVDEVLRVMQQLNSEGLTQILVTHEIAFARKLAEQLVFMHEGELVECGTPSLLFQTPRREETRSFLSKFSEVTVQAHA